jgi:ribosomal protein L13
MLTKLKVYATPDHPHAAQQPKPLPITTRTTKQDHR